MFFSRSCFFLLSVLTFRGDLAVDARKLQKKSGPGPVAARVMEKKYRSVSTGGTTIAALEITNDDNIPDFPECNRKLTSSDVVVGGPFMTADAGRKVHEEAQRKLQDGPPTSIALTGTVNYVNGNVFGIEDVEVDDSGGPVAIPPVNPDCFYSQICTVVDSSAEITCDRGVVLTVEKQECRYTICDGHDEDGVPNCFYALFSGALPFEIAGDTLISAPDFYATIVGGSGDYLGAAGKILVQDARSGESPTGDGPSVIDFHATYVTARYNDI